MKSFHLNDEMHKQSLAEAAERAGAPAGRDADVEAYRSVIRAASRPLSEQLPAGFAEAVAARVAEEQPGLLDRLTPMVGIVVLGTFAIVSSGPYLGGVLQQLDQAGLGRLPWPMLGAAALSLVAVGLSDRWMKKT